MGIRLGAAEIFLDMKRLKSPKNESSLASSLGGTFGIHASKR